MGVTVAHTEKVPYHSDNEEFDLTLVPISAVQMVASGGYGNVEDWRFTGTELHEPVTCCFKWVGVDSCSNLNEVQERLMIHGDIPKGQWREALIERFNPDNEHPRGIADPSWVNPNGERVFPCITRLGDPFFNVGDVSLYQFWRWLVEVKS